MAKPHFHLAWFLSQGYGPKTWRGDWPGSDVARWMMPDLFLDLARGMERACFDYLIIEDSSMLPYTFRGTHDTYLQYAASTPKPSLTPGWPSMPCGSATVRPSIW